MENVSVPKKSSSMVILRTRNHEVQVLLIERKSGQDFENTYSFPGGKVEMEDIEYVQRYRERGSDQRVMLNKVAVMREVYEETGLLVGRWQSGGRVISRSSRFRDLYGYLDMDSVQELVRIISPQQLKSRYDNQFMIMNCQDSLMNVGLYMKSGLIDDLNNIDDVMIDVNESDQYIWIGLNQCMLRNRKGEIKLSPPIVMIVQSLSRLTNVERVNEYIRLINPRLLSFPYIPVPMQSSQNTEFILIGDNGFKTDEVIRRETDNELRNEMSKEYEWFEQGQESKYRFRFRSDCMVGVEIMNQKYTQLFDLAVEQTSNL